MGEAKDEFAPPKTRKVDADGEFTDAYKGHEHAKTYARRLMRAIGRKTTLIPDEEAKQKKIEAAAVLLSEYHYKRDTDRADDDTLTLTDDEIDAYVGDPKRLKLLKRLQETLEPGSGKGKTVSLKELRKILDSEKLRVADALTGGESGEKPTGSLHASLTYQTRAIKLAEHLISEAGKDKDQQDEEKVALAERAVQALLYFDVMSQLAAPDDDDTAALRKRWADTMEQYNALLPFDNNLEADAGKNMQQAGLSLNFGNPDDAEDLLDKSDARLKAAKATAKQAALDRADTIAKDAATEAALGTDLSAITQVLADARSAAKKGKFAEAKEHSDAAKRMLFEAQGDREIDIASEIRPIWTTAKTAFQKSIKEIEDKIKAHDPPLNEMKLLTKLGVKSWTDAPLTRVSDAIERLKKVPAGPAGMTDRFSAAAVFRDVKSELGKHPAGAIMTQNPWKVTFDIGALGNTLDRLADVTMKTNGDGKAG